MHARERVSVSTLPIYSPLQSFFNHLSPIPHDLGSYQPYKLAAASGPTLLPQFGASLALDQVQPGWAGGVGGRMN